MYIKVVGDTAKYHGELECVNEHLIKVTGLVKNLNGFRLYLDNDTLIGDYSAYTYLYDDPTLGAGIYEYSDNNMSYEDIGKPSQKEQAENKVKEIVEESVGKDIKGLSEQINNLSEMFIPMYSAILDMQTLIATATTPTTEDMETPVVDDGNKETINNDDATTTNDKSLKK